MKGPGERKKGKECLRMSNVPIRFQEGWEKKFIWGKEVKYQEKGY